MTHENLPVVRIAVSKSFCERVAGYFELRDLKQINKHAACLAVKVNRASNTADWRCNACVDWGVHIKWGCI
jgi:hypothetical protein